MRHWAPRHASLNSTVGFFSTEGALFSRMLLNIQYFCNNHVHLFFYS